MITVAVLAGGLLTMSSCVSSKKYKEAVSTRDQQIQQLQADNSQLQSDKQRLQSSLEEANSTSERARREMSEALNDEQAKMQSMRMLVNAQRDAIRKLKQEVCSALKCFTPDELSIEVRDGKLYVSLFDKLLFPSGSDVVNSRGKEAIGMLASVLGNSDLEVMVEGHTDSVPINTSRNKDNWDLSVHRATSVSRLLIEDGLPPQRLIAGGRGKFHPIKDNTTAEGRQSNRRTEIVLAPKLDNLWKLTEESPDSTSTSRN